MDHHFRNRLLRGDLLVGTMVTLNSPEVTELLARIGFDWLFIDAEHSPLTMIDIQRMVQAAGKECPCIVRLPEATEVPVKQALDIGAAGIIAPLVNSAGQAEDIVRMAKYAPNGSRGVGVSRAHKYGLGFQEYLDRANEETAVIVQVEHIDAVADIESIARVRSIDAVFVGPYDLSASLGKLGQVNDPEVQSAIETVTEVSLQAGMKLGIFGLSPESVKPFIDRGYTLIVAGIDTMMLGSTASQLLADIR
ncbi:MAG: aldolase/citrate lyase family protein [Chloroflexota bacterium]|jgi:2-keto-3-deoxy-L-rhamnonate aldolase RhmA